MFMLSGVARRTDGRFPELLRSTARRHWHRFRWSGEDPVSNGSLYACRCGVVRPGF